MEEEEKVNLFETFKSVMESAVKEKQEIPKWNEKLNNADIKANISLQVGQ
ncbi:MAG: hypothetical protein GF364_18395, partial [Candidatus Lokiarchaeota archaeon]|nr:hypothetical protein [Candidatus Lokiarchaeota archaeon]